MTEQSRDRAASVGKRHSCEPPWMRRVVQPEPKQKGLLLTNRSRGRPPGGSCALLSSLCPTGGTGRIVGNAGLPCVTERREADCALVTVPTCSRIPHLIFLCHAWKTQRLSCHSDPPSTRGLMPRFHGSDTRLRAPRVHLPPLPRMTSC